MAVVGERSGSLQLRYTARHRSTGASAASERHPAAFTGSPCCRSIYPTARRYPVEALSQPLCPIFKRLLAICAGGAPLMLSTVCAPGKCIGQGKQMRRKMPRLRHTRRALLIGPSGSTPRHRWQHKLQGCVRGRRSGHVPLYSASLGGGFRGRRYGVNRGAMLSGLYGAHPSQSSRQDGPVPTMCGSLIRGTSLGWL